MAFTTLHSLRHAAYELSEQGASYDPILDFIGDSQFVLLGESTHGTHEFYHHRAEITKQLITKKGFRALLVEGDWPEMCRVNRYVRHASSDQSASDALSDFHRFPSWMWRNQEFHTMVKWLYQYNSQLTVEDRIGAYGLDLYSLYTSAKAVIQHLEVVDPSLAGIARQRYECLDGFSGDPQKYGLSAALGLTNDCESAVVSQLKDLVTLRYKYLEPNGIPSIDAQFCAERNARVVQNAEFYYRALVTGSHNTWNLRDAHMFETLEALARHLTCTRDNSEAKIVIWAHNSHVGDARATEMGRSGEFNLGELVRTKYPDRCKLIGFTTSVGSVIAASQWQGPASVMEVRPPLKESYEALFSKLELEAFFLPLTEATLRKELRTPQLQRAIGVIYRPDSERMSHYFLSDIIDQFDGVIHIEESSALTPAWLQATSTPSLRS